MVIVGWQLWSDHSFEQRLTPLVSGIAGRSVEVDCQNLHPEMADFPTEHPIVAPGGRVSPQ